MNYGNSKCVSCLWFCISLLGDTDLMLAMWYWYCGVCVAKSSSRKRNVIVQLW